jgi:hypothetical protein
MKHSTTETSAEFDNVIVARATATQFQMPVEYTKTGQKPKALGFDIPRLIAESSLFTDVRKPR